jgi:DNA repair protein RecO (recombination protein O)
MARTYRDTGIVLQKYDLGEADSLVTLLLHDSGLTRAVAKGVRKMSSRKRGHVEVFNNIDALLSRGRNLDVLAEATALDTYNLWREDLSRVSLAYYAADITLMMLPEEEPHPEISQRLNQFLSWLGHANQPANLVRWYEVQLLSNLGYWSAGQLSSSSANAIELLRRFPDLSAQQISSLRVAPQLANELERLLNLKLGTVLERQTKSQKFVDMVRELEER